MAWLRLALACLVLLLPARAAAQESEVIVDGLSWMIGYPSTWIAGAPKLVSDGLFYYAVFCGRSSSPNLCTVARKRGDGAEAWEVSSRVFWSSQPATVVIDRKGRLNIFFNDYQLKHFRIDVPSVNLDHWLQIATDFFPQVGYLHASYNAVSDEMLITFNETGGYRLYVGRKVGEGPWTYAPAPAAPAGVMYLYARTVGMPGHYAILVGEYAVDGSNTSYTAALLFESTSALGPWTTRQLYRVSGLNVGVPYQNWVLANDLQADHQGRLRALLHITEGGSGHATPRDGLYALREEDGYVPHFVGSPIEDAFSLYADPAGPLVAFAGGATATSQYAISWFTSTDEGQSWQRQAATFPDAVNPVPLDVRSGSMIGPNLHVLASHWNFTTRAFDQVVFGSIPLSPANTADRFAYDIADSDGTTDSTRGYHDTASGRMFSYVYDRHPDGSFSWTYNYSAGSYTQSYTGDSLGSYHYTNSDGVDLAYDPLTLTTVSPSTITLGAAATLTVNGANFQPGALVRVNGVSRATTFVSSTRLTAPFSPSDATMAPATRSLTVLNADGAVSNALIVTITASPATLTASSASVNAGGTATFTVANGPSNRLDWVGWFCPPGGDDLSYLDWKYFTNSWTAPASGAIGATITFTMPSAAGATCVARLFADNGFTRLVSSATVTAVASNPVPALASLAPASVVAGTATTISVTGTNFVPGSVVRVNGIARTTTFVSGTQLSAALLAGDVATVGVNPSITVFTGAPGGGTSNALTLAVVSTPSNPTVTGPSSSLPGNAVSIAVSNGPGHPTDWVGWFCPRTSADTAYIDWKYLNNTKVAPAGGLTSATVTFQMPATGGICEARLFANNGFSMLAAGDPVATAGGGLQLTLGPGVVAPRGTLTVTAVNGGGMPTSRLAWVGLFCPSASNDAAYIDWQYMNNAKVAPPSAWSSPASITFTAPATAGINCDVRLFSNNGFARMASSAPVSVTAMPLTLTLGSALVSGGGTIPVTIAHGPGPPRDWLARDCGSPGGEMTAFDWKYLNGSRTPPSTGMTAATVTFTAPAAPRSCTVQLFADDSFTRLATSPQISVQ